ncbi:hypothetical protein G7K_1193-t1 [Saitoella complicata NRRL Y-17804]|uniref:Uncharacterized protein n=1 Tax=Saitoella complicata (strain BCRC 22490 / CBS 7301 / JCM 7358 / NBRC 10748 / NRRL Y-17804) TaxID=698492 RepID=A0A0E9NAX6_SAICN|nr:hypothetical protein G7K_1193-t1 [Saitoella complicata NRRL Y-17804]
MQTFKNGHRLSTSGLRTLRHSLKFSAKRANKCETSAKRSPERSYNPPLTSLDQGKQPRTDRTPVHSRLDCAAAPLQLNKTISYTKSSRTLKSLRRVIQPPRAPRVRSEE